MMANCMPSVALFDISIKINWLLIFVLLLNPWKFVSLQTVQDKPCKNCADK